MYYSRSNVRQTVHLPVPQPTFVAELKEPKYVVAMRTKPSVQTDQEGHTARTVTMTDTNGKRCVQNPTRHHILRACLAFHLLAWSLLDSKVVSCWTSTGFNVIFRTVARTKGWTVQTNR
jgi:hypothetical protein